MPSGCRTPLASQTKPMQSTVASPSPGLGSSAAEDLFGSGLTSLEATRRLAERGPNELHPVSRAMGLWEFCRQFANPLVLILLGASFVSAYLHERTNALIIVAIVVLSVVLEFVQTDRSRRAADRLLWVCRRGHGGLSGLHRTRQTVALASRVVTLSHSRAGSVSDGQAQLLFRRENPIEKAPSLTLPARCFIRD